MKENFQELSAVDSNESDQLTDNDSTRDSDQSDNSQNELTSNYDSENSSSERIEYNEMSLEEIRDLYNDTERWENDGDEITDAYEETLQEEYFDSCKTGDYNQAVELLDEIENYCGFDYKEVKKFIAYEEYVFPKDVTALQMAIILNNPQKVEEILAEYKDKPNYIFKRTGKHLAKGPFKATTLHYAIYYNRTSIVSELINFIKKHVSYGNFQRHIVTGDDQTILHLAALKNINIEIIKIIINLYSYYHSVEVISFIKDTVAQSLTTKFVRQLHRTLTSQAFVTQEFAELIDRKNAEGQSPLYLAVSTNKVEIVELLAPYSSNINCQFAGGNTLLHIASENGFEDIVNILLKHKMIKLNIENRDLNTPLLLAVLNDHENIVVRLCAEIGTSYAEDSGINKVISKEEALRTRAIHEISDEMDEEFGATPSQIHQLLDGSKIELVLDKTTREEMELDDPLEDMKEMEVDGTLQARMQDIEKSDENPSRYEKAPLYLAIEREQLKSVQALLALPATDLENRGQKNRAISIAKKMIGKENAVLILSLKKDIQSVIRISNFGKNRGIKKYIHSSLLAIQKKLSSLEIPYTKKEVKKKIEEGKLNELISFFESLKRHNNIKKNIENCVSHIENLKESRLKAIVEKFKIFTINDIQFLLDDDTGLLSEIITTNETELLEKIKSELNRIAIDDEAMSNWSQAETDLICDNDAAKIYLMLKRAFRNRQLESTTGGESEDETCYEDAKKLLLNELDEIERITDSENDDSHLSPIIVIPRGINFRTDHFSTDSKQSYLKRLNTIHTFYCASAYRLAGYEPGDIEADETELKNQANKIKLFITKLKKTEPVEAWWKVANKKHKKFANLYYAIQQRYTNSKDAFSGLWKEIPDSIKKIMRQIDANAETLLAENIFVSGSSLIRHTIRYALGLSFSSSKLEYLANGRYRHDSGVAKYPTLGVIFFSLWNKEDYLKSAAVNVPQLHAQAKVHIVPDLLNETEVTFPGYLKNIKFAYPILLPLFNKEYTSEDQKLFGFSAKQFDEFKQKIEATKRSDPERVEVEKELENHLLDHYEKMFMSIIRHKANKLGFHLLFEYPDEIFNIKEPKPSDIKEQAKNLHDEAMEKREQNNVQTINVKAGQHKKGGKKRKLLEETTSLPSNSVKKQKTNIEYLGQSMSKGLTSGSSANNLSIQSNDKNTGSDQTISYSRGAPSLNLNNM